MASKIAPGRKAASAVKSRRATASTTTNDVPTALTETLDNVLNQLQSPKLFPFGITKINLTLSLPGNISASINVEGPGSGKAPGVHDSLLGGLMRVANVDIGASDADRAKAYVLIVEQALLELDGVKKDNVIRFLVRTGWHEGAKLTARVQVGGGPARSFLQMEPGAAKDGILRASAKGWSAAVAAAGSISETDLSEAADDLVLGSPWPSGNRVESALKTYDLFGVEVGRAYLSASPTQIPTDRTAQANYWESEWHRVSAPAKKAQWLANARVVDALLGWI